MKIPLPSVINTNDLDQSELALRSKTPWSSGHRVWRSDCNAREFAPFCSFSAVLILFLLRVVLIFLHVLYLTPSCSSLYVTSWKCKLKRGSRVGGRTDILPLPPTLYSGVLQRFLPVLATVSPHAPCPGWPIDKWHVGCVRWADRAVHACLHITDAGSKHSQTSFHP